VPSIFPYFKVVAYVGRMGSDVCYAVCDLCLRRKRLIFQTRPGRPIKHWAPTLHWFSNLKLE